MNHEELESLLRSLPRERASEGFTERVMRRLESVRRPIYLQPRFALAASLMLGVALLAGSRWLGMVEKESAKEKIHALRSDFEALGKDIRLLKDLAPVIYLGGTEDVDFVIDLGELARQEKTGAKPVSLDVKPSSEKGETRQ